jgi:hypothetical protein
VLQRRHFQLVADILKIFYRRSDDQRSIVAAIAYQFADTFTLDNPRFDRDRFLRACGLE